MLWSLSHKDSEKREWLQQGEEKAEGWWDKGVEEEEVEEVEEGQ